MATITGTTGDDTLNGTTGDDVIVGLEGNDTIRPDAGDDYVDGGDGNDNIYVTLGETGIKTLLGGAGNDFFDIGGFTGGAPTGTGGSIDGGVGQDIARISFVNTGAVSGITLDASTTSIYDIFSTYAGFTVQNVESFQIYGTIFDDVIAADDSNMDIFAHAGDDHIIGGAGNNTLSGDSGNDVLEGRGGRDYLYGGYGDDIIDGGDGNDYINGGDGADDLTGGAGADTFGFVADIDGDIIRDFEAGDSIQLSYYVDGSTLPTFIGTADFTGTENEYRYHYENDAFILELDEDGDGVADQSMTVEGDEVYLDVQTASNSVITIRAMNLIEGTSGDDTLQGTGGSDLILGEEGDDVLTGNGGSDRLDGGDGHDTADYTFSEESIYAYISFTGGGYELRVQDYTAAAGYSNDTLISIEEIVGSAYDDSIYLSAESDPFQATVPGMTLRGGDGYDSIYGGRGDDMIFGGNDNDYLSGYGGADTIEGGAGEDRFNYFGQQNGASLAEQMDGDVIVDLEAGEFIQFSSLGTEYFAEDISSFLGLGAFTGTANELRYEYADGNTILSYDEDGDGVADAQMTILGDTLALSLNYHGGGYLYIQAQTAVFGTSGDDTLEGTADSEYFFGFEGDDVFVVSAGSDTFDGDDGYDIADYSTHDVRINVLLSYSETNTNLVVGAYAGEDYFTDTLLSVEEIIGTAFDDFLFLATESADFQLVAPDITFRAGAGDDTIYAGRGNDIIYGDDGADWLAGYGGADTLSGGAGIDRFTYYGQSDGASWAEQMDGDVITDLEAGEAIVFTTNDQEGSPPGISSFVGMGAFTGTANELRYEFVDGDTILSFDEDGDGVADAQMTILGQNVVLEREVSNSFYFSLKALTAISGTDGDDTLTGTDDADGIFGLAGDDTFIPTTGDDTIYGGDGFDSVSYDGVMNVFLRADYFGDEYFISANGRINEINFLDTLWSVEHVIGSADSDYIDLWLPEQFAGQGFMVEGRGGDDNIFTGFGDDRILSGYGDDVIAPGGGTDIVNGSNGTDIYFTQIYYPIEMGPQSAVMVDLVSGIAEDGFGFTDTLISIEGASGGSVYRDQFIGNDEDNVFYLYSGGQDSVLAGGGDDIIYLSQFGGNVNGGDGVDTIGFYDGTYTPEDANEDGYYDILFATTGVRASLETSRVYEDGMGGSGRIWNFENIDGNFLDDHLTGNEVDNVLSGYGGADTLYGRDGNDTLNGGADNDRLYGGRGNDKLYGDEGNDYIIGSAGNDLISGGDGNDYLRGYADDDRIFGGAGADRITGDAGDDYLVGNEGDDRLDGGAGNDELQGREGNDLVYGRDGNDRLFGNEGDDQLYGAEGVDVISGNDGADLIYGGTGADQLYGGFGDDIMYGGTDNDYIVGNQDNDTLYGEDGNDNIQGRIGDDTLYGGDGNDYMKGGTGDDVLDGGAGYDSLYGEEGLDTFVFTGNWSRDKVMDWEEGDTLDLSSHGLQGPDDTEADAFAKLTIVQDGDDTLINITGDDVNSIRLIGIDASTIDANDFDFTGAAAEAQGAGKAVVSEIQIGDSFDFAGLETGGEAAVSPVMGAWEGEAVSMPSPLESSYASISVLDTHFGEDAAVLPTGDYVPDWISHYGW